MLVIIGNDYDKFSTGIFIRTSNLGWNPTKITFGQLFIPGVERTISRWLSTDQVRGLGGGNSVKSNRTVDVENTHFPHRDNTYLDFVYDESGRVKVNPDLPSEEYVKAENLYNLVKLGRWPFGVAAASESDYRWRHRYETWKLASRYLKYYEANSIDLKTIIDLSMSQGNWSIWFTIFKGHDEVRKALIDCFPGTCASCFDSGNHYEPIPRKLRFILQNLFDKPEWRETKFHYAEARKVASERRTNSLQ